MLTGRSSKSRENHIFRIDFTFFSKGTISNELLDVINLKVFFGNISSFLIDLKEWPWFYTPNYWLWLMHCVNANVRSSTILISNSFFCNRIYNQGYVLLLYVTCLEHN